LLRSRSSEFERVDADVDAVEAVVDIVDKESSGRQADPAGMNGSGGGEGHHG
jgi:hypothetical protein